MTPTMVSSAAMERRKLAESEDIHFVGRVQASSLLGQALQFPSMGDHSCSEEEDHVEHDDDDDEEEYVEEDHDQGHTPTSITRKRHDVRPSTRYSNSTSTSSSNRRLSNFHDSVTSNASTRAIDNRHDPLAMSLRSLQSDEVPPIVPQSVDTVQTSNVAIYHQYQFQQQQQYGTGTGTGISNLLNNHNSHRNRHAHAPAPASIPPHLSVSPPSNLRYHYPSPIASSNAAANAAHANANATNERRSVFGNRVQKKYPSYGGRSSSTSTVYPHPPPPDPAPFYNIIDQGRHTLFQQAEQQPPDWEILPSSPRAVVRNSFTTSAQSQDDKAPLSVIVTVTTPTCTSSTSMSTSNSSSSTKDSNHNHVTSTSTSTAARQKQQTPNVKSPPPSPTTHRKLPMVTSPTNLLDQDLEDDFVSPLKSPSFLSPAGPSPAHESTMSASSQRSRTNNSNNNSASKKHKGNRRKSGGHDHHHHHHYHKHDPTSSNHTNNNSNHGKSLSLHETVHAQSLLLGLCFMAIWSPNNIMAPNLTQVANFYHMTVQERDLYLGSILALATGVLSLPLSAVISVWADLYSRKVLFVATALGGALASAATGLAPTYPWLLLSRFFSGGFMGASTSVAFSLMGDLFATEERNAASSGLTAMMGLGIILGQVYAGVIGNEKGWQHAFYVSSITTAVLGFAVAWLVQEPVRGGKEKALQDMLKHGKQYDRKLTWHGFLDAMSNNRSNRIIVTQGFFASVPWGIIFVFLNDFLSQERGFSVPDATFIVLVFGMGSAVGGIVGGSAGSWVVALGGRSYLPLFMAAATVLGIFPYLALLNGHTQNAHGYLAILYSFLAGCISNLPSVNVRPCLLNVNPPETRGASLTAANLIINFGRGIGPCCITLLSTNFGISRRASFNTTLTSFWIISAIQLCFLAQSLPQDQDKMEAELAHYAASAMALVSPTATSTVAGDRSTEGGGGGGTSLLEFAMMMEGGTHHSTRSHDEVSLFSIEDRWTSFDANAARESISFLKKGVEELTLRGNFCSSHVRDSLAEESSEDNDSDSNISDHEHEQHHSTYGGGDEDEMSPGDMIKTRDLWKQQQRQLFYGTSGEASGNEHDHVVSETMTCDKPPSTETTRLL